MLECVINISEGRDPLVLAQVAEAAGGSLLDLHSDPEHNRSVLTLAGDEVVQAAEQVARTTVALTDISTHVGAHPRLGVVDVVPFVPLPDTGSDLSEARDARLRFATWFADELGVPCFIYGEAHMLPRRTRGVVKTERKPIFGEERTLPEVRKGAFTTLAPTIGPRAPHPTAGACAVGARDLLVAYNLWLREPDVALARQVAKEIRRPGLRAIGLDLAGRAQVSCNLVDPYRIGPGDAYDLVAARAPVAAAELVGLLPAALLCTIPEERWRQLDLDPAKTIEARLTS